MNNEQHSEAVTDTIRYSTGQFDKNIVFIASGALGISFAFIKDIIPDLQKADCISSLINSWYIFAGVIFISLVTHFISMLANSWAAKNAGLDNNAFNDKIAYWNWPIRTLNILMILGILIGALLLISFININLTS